MDDVRLQLQLDGKVALQVSLGDGVAEPLLRASRDHLAVQLKLSDAWLARQHARAQGPDLAEESEECEVELCCRACRAPLLRERSAEEGPLQALHLPTDLWQACAEVVACEECMPMGQGHLRAQPGRLFVSAQSLLAARGDLSMALVPSEGLVRCSCGAVVGEADGTRTSKRPGKVARKLCSWGHVCRSAGVLLYKHRASLPLRSRDALAEYTEEASVLAHLLTLRISEGQSRFVVLPSHPSLEVLRDGQAFTKEALELRLVLPELLLLRGDQVQLASKVLFRACRCAALPELTQVVVPQEAFEALCSSLDFWVQRLPPSLTAAPGADWQCSYLPRPPEMTFLEHVQLQGLDQALHEENLAAAFQGTGRALTVLEGAFPAEVKDVRPAGTRARLAQILHQQGRSSEDWSRGPLNPLRPFAPSQAVGLLRHALKEYEGSLGKDHPQTLNCARNLAVLLKQSLPAAGSMAGQLAVRLAEAEALLKRAASGYAKVLGAEHPETERFRRNLANFRKWRRRVWAFSDSIRLLVVEDPCLSLLRLDTMVSYRTNTSLELEAMVLAKHAALRDALAAFYGNQVGTWWPMPGEPTYMPRLRRGGGSSFLFVGDKSDDAVPENVPDEGALKEKEEAEEFAMDEFPKTCRMELKPGEGRACESPEVEGCMDSCRSQYLVPRKVVQKPLPEEGRKVCYNACIDHCVMGRTQDGFARPQCPLVNGYSERYSVWESYEKLDPEKEVAKAAAGTGPSAAFLAPPSSKAELPKTESPQEDLGPLDPHGHPFKQNKVCGHVLAPGEQRCCERSTVEACHECCVQRNFDGIQGEPSSDTCRRTCVRMCYKGKDGDKAGKHLPRCPDDAETKVSLYPTNAQFSYSSFYQYC
eukprot:s1299_g7.t1